MEWFIGVWRKFGLEKIYRKRIRRRGLTRCFLAIVIATGTLSFVLFEVFVTAMDPDLYTPLEPKITADFPVIKSMNSTIPKTIHQIWNDYVIPTETVENVQVLRRNHPHWDYRFWTLKTGRCFIQKHFPDLLDIYDSFAEPIDKSDLLRYAILYKYGGVFLDLDIAILRPLDRVVQSFQCVLVREPPEHASLLYNTEIYLANGLLFTRPGHPLFKQLLQYTAAFKHNTRPCGTRMFTSNVLIYNKSDEAKVAENSVYIAPSQFFLDDIEPTLHGRVRWFCRGYQYLGLIHQRGCASYIRRFVLEAPKSAFTFTSHKWHHSNHLTFQQENDVRTIVKDVQVYDEDTERLDNKQCQLR